TLPSKEVGKRAEEMLKKINGIVSVINECKIVAPASTGPQQVADAVKRKPEPNLRAPKVVNDPTEVRLPPLPPPPAAVLLPPEFSPVSPTSPAPSSPP